MHQKLTAFVSCGPLSREARAYLRRGARTVARKLLQDGGTLVIPPKLEVWNEAAFAALEALFSGCGWVALIYDGRDAIHCGVLRRLVRMTERSGCRVMFLPYHPTGAESAPK